MRRNNAVFCMMRSENAAIFGAMVRSIAWNSGSLMVPLQTLYSANTRDAVRPARSWAAMVLSKVGGAGSDAMLSISARFSRMAASSAGSKCATRISSNGGTPPYGPRHSRRRGFVEVLMAGSSVERWSATLKLGAARARRHPRRSAQLRGSGHALPAVVRPLVQEPFGRGMFSLRTLLRVADADGDPIHPKLDGLGTERLRRRIGLRRPSGAIARGDVCGIDEIQPLAGTRHGWPRFVHQAGEQLDRVAGRHREWLVDIGMRSRPRTLRPKRRCDRQRGDGEEAQTTNHAHEERIIRAAGIAPLAAMMRAPSALRIKSRNRATADGGSTRVIR